MTSNNEQPILEDVNVIVAGQGGDGSLTVVTMLAELFRTSGFVIFIESLRIGISHFYSLIQCRH